MEAPKKFSKARTAWDELNGRQRIYLRALYNEDQGLEEEHRREAAMGRYSRAPARVWRRIYLFGRYAPVPQQLRAHGVWDSGAGATLAALAGRGLIERGQDFVLLARAGRAAVRAGLGIAPTPRRLPWELSEGLWREMARVARAGAAGARGDAFRARADLYLTEGYGHINGNRPYLREQGRRYVFTDTGRAHYAEHVAQYREWYPEIEAPDLPAPGSR